MFSCKSAKLWWKYFYKIYYNNYNTNGLYIEIIQNDNNNHNKNILNTNRIIMIIKIAIYYNKKNKNNKFSGLFIKWLIINLITISLYWSLASLLVEQNW